MKTQKQQYLSPAAIACVLFLSTLFIPSANAFTWFDDFEYSGWTAGDTPANVNWSNASGSGTVSFTNNPGYSGDTYVQLNGRLISHSLGQTISDDWSLSIDVAMSSSENSRFFWIGLLNTDGTNGYGFYWEGGATSVNYGTVRLGKYDVPTNPSALAWNTKGDGMSTTAVSSGHLKTSDVTAENAFAKFELTWSSMTGTLVLTIDGNQKFTVDDKSFSSFGSIYMGGNGGVYIDNLSITAIPEPKTYAVVLGILTLFAIGIRRKLA